MLPSDVLVQTRTDSEITFTTPEDFDSDKLRDLVLSWGISDDENVFVSFTLASGDAFGPFPISSTSLVPEPSSAVLLLLGLAGLLRRRRTV